LIDGSDQDLMYELKCVANLNHVTNQLTKGIETALN